ncbi:MAG: DUF190 domain-containing protein [Nitrospirae bacterium]|nr:DUF190 domain-containing protein [Nitrospirota bacterium]
MKLAGEGKMVRIFLGETDHYHHQPLYEVILRKAREAGLAGGTVLRGVMGFGAVSRIIHTAKILRLSEDLPVVVEIVDREEKVNAFLPVIEGLFEETGCGGMITLERMEIIAYTPGRK